MKAIWNGVTIAESDDTVVIEGNHYFPRHALTSDALRESEHTSVCPWKGIARYFDVVAEGEVNPNAAWNYPDPKPAAEAIRGRVAFWKGVRVVP